MNGLPIVTLIDLRPGDVLLHHTNGLNLVSILIREFSGDDFLHPAEDNHASLYLGDGYVAEMVEKGASKDTIQSACEGDTVHVARWHDGDTPGIAIEPDNVWDNGLGSPKYPFQPVIDYALNFIAEGGKYYYADLIELAILTQIRNSPMKEAVVQEVLSVIDSMVEINRLLKVCSELVFDCFMQTGHNIKIVGLDASMVYPPISGIPEGQYVSPHALAMSPNLSVIGQLQL